MFSMSYTDSKIPSKNLGAYTSINSCSIHGTKDAIQWGNWFLEAGASTPYKRWSKWTMETLVGRFVQKLRGEVRNFPYTALRLALMIVVTRCQI